MSKWYGVEITAFKTVVVEMEDNATLEDALHFAKYEVSFCSNDIVKSDIAELRTEQQIDCAKRHADQVEAL